MLKQIQEKLIQIQKNKINNDKLFNISERTLAILKILTLSIKYSPNDYKKRIQIPLSDLNLTNLEVTFEEKRFIDGSISYDIMWLDHDKLLLNINKYLEELN